MVDRILRDGAVTLRPWRDGDLDDIVEMCQDAEIARWTRVPQPYGEDDARQFLADESRGSKEGTFFGFAITDTESDAVVGSVGVSIVAAGTGDIGYFVSAGARRRGIGKRSLLLVSRWALKELGLARAQITIRPENIPSRRLAESCGYRYEGVLRSLLLTSKDERVDAAVYSLLPGEIG